MTNNKTGKPCSKCGCTSYVYVKEGSDGESDWEGHYACEQCGRGETQDEVDATREAIKNLQEKDPEKYEALLKRAKGEVAEEGLRPDYLNQPVEEEVTEKPRRFGEGSSAEPDNTNL